MKDITLKKFPGHNSLVLKKITSKPKNTNHNYLIDADEKTTRAIIQSLKSKNKTIAILGRDNKFNRRALETLKINYLISPERGSRKDTLKQKDSGLNHFLAKRAKQKNIAIVINFTESRSVFSSKNPPYKRKKEETDF
jgi:RNase P/RNase MRP subunit p30